MYILSFSSSIRKNRINKRMLPDCDLADDLPVSWLECPRVSPPTDTANWLRMRTSPTVFLYSC